MQFDLQCCVCLCCMGLVSTTGHLLYPHASSQTSLRAHNRLHTKHGWCSPLSAAAAAAAAAAEQAARTALLALSQGLSNLHLKVCMHGADGLLHESCIQKFPVHKEMEKIWPTEEDCLGFK